MDKAKRPIDRRVLIFLGITFVLTWGLLGYMISTGIAYGSTASTLYLMACMFMPALATVITRIVTKEGFGDLLLKPNLKVKKNIKYYLLAAYGPIALILLGGALYYLLFPQNFDANFTSVRALIGNAPTNIGTLFLLQLAQVLLLGPFINVIPTLGEELGWRGYLLPKLLKQHSAAVSVVATGIIWGLWHAPMIALGHNYGTDYWGYPYTGVLLMTVFCVFFGMLLSYVTLKTGSVIPAAVGHSSLNAAAALPMMMMVPGTSQLLGPGIMGIIAVIPTVILGCILLRKSRGVPQVELANGGLTPS